MRARTRERRLYMEQHENSPILRITNLTKFYHAADKPAVDDLSMSCFEGEIVGLLGHNGAGKSTTLKCITGVLPFSKGEILINGHNLEEAPVKAKRTFGYVSDKHDVFVKLTGLQFVDFMANAYGVGVKERKERLEELEDVFRLGDRIFDTINDYSHGMRQKICMMGSLIHSPKLWIMDEPMIGLDPLTSQRVSDFMKEYAKKGNCILFSSHNINSVQKLCDRAVIIQNGVKTDDFYFEQFECEHPDVNLEEYFLSRTAKEQAK